MKQDAVLIHHAIQDLLDDGVSPQNICYFSVDNPLYTGMGLEQSLEYYQKASPIDLQKDRCYVSFDEIQHLRDWEIHLKVVVDNYKNIKCCVSGSAAAALRLKSIESGAGRFTTFLLPPLTFPEYLVLLNQDDLVEINEDFDSFCGTQDIEVLNKKFVRLFTTLAFNTASEVSLKELSKGSGVAKNTVKKYIEYLETAIWDNGSIRNIPCTLQGGTTARSISLTSSLVVNIIGRLSSNGATGSMIGLQI